MEKVKAVAEATGSLMTAAVLPLPARPTSSAASTTVATTWMAPPRSASPGVASDMPTAPSPTTPAPANPSGILDELVGSIDGVRSALLASVDGFGLARSSSMSDEAAHPAMLAAAIGLAHQLVAMGGGNQLRQLVVDHDGGLMLVWPLGDERVLAVLATSTVEQRRVRSFVTARAAWLSGAAA